MTTKPVPTHKLPARPTGKTASGLSPETDALLQKMMKQSGMSHRKMKEVQETIAVQGALPKPAPPKKYNPNKKPKPEQKVFTMARVGQRPLVKPADQIIEETNYYQPEKAPDIPIGPSNEERKRQLVAAMSGIDEEAERITREQELAEYEPQAEFTMADQLLEEIHDRTDWLEEMQGMGNHQHDKETLRQIDQRMEELRAIQNKKGQN